MDNNNKGFFWLIVLLTMLFSFIVFDITSKKFKLKDSNTETTITTTKNTKDNKKDNVVQTLNTNIGTFILSKDGYVFYIESNESIFNIENYTNLGEKGTYTIDDYLLYDEYNNPINTVEAFKLDIENINSLYEIKFNNETNIIMLNKNGQISILSFNITNTNNLIITFEKNLDEYNNIVSVLTNNNSVILVDKDGNKYNFYK